MNIHIKFSLQIITDIINLLYDLWSQFLFRKSHQNLTLTKTEVARSIFAIHYLRGIVDIGRMLISLVNISLKSSVTGISGTLRMK